MIMEPFEVYRYYLALRLHFTTDQYDVIKQQGRVRASKNAFFKRKDLMSIQKVAKTYSDKDVVDFLIANFVELMTMMSKVPPLQFPSVIANFSLSPVERLCADDSVNTV